jgi:uncharacterized flavoprotein (TIGR03862 family)
MSLARQPSQRSQQHAEPALNSEAVAVIGAGPAGLMAAQVISAAGHAVSLFDAMPSVGRKLLLAGKGGLNLTHTDSPDQFAERYGSRRVQIEALLDGFGATELRQWAQSLGIETFVGSSGRVFPKSMKASPLLRAWLQHLRNPQQGVGVDFHLRHRWLGWNEAGTALRFDTPAGAIERTFKAVVLALGGGSWARLGSNGAWVPVFQARGIAVAPLVAANCGFDVGGLQSGWTAHFSSRFAGQPFKSVAIALKDSKGRAFSRKGEFVATATGVEGSLIYGASSLLRDEIAHSGQATFLLDLLPDWSLQRVLTEVSHPRGSRSLSSHLKSRLKLEGIKAAVLYEVLSKEDMNQPEVLAHFIKALPIRLVAARPIDEAISSAGGVLFEVLTPELMIEHLPGVFCAGEMLDWEAPTGGYLLTACLASGRKAGLGVLSFLKTNRMTNATDLQHNDSTMTATLKEIDEPRII